MMSKKKVYILSIEESSETSCFYRIWRCALSVNRGGDVYIVRTARQDWAHNSSMWLTCLVLLVLAKRRRAPVMRYQFLTNTQWLEIEVNDT